MEPNIHFGAGSGSGMFYAMQLIPLKVLQTMVPKIKGRKKEL